MCLFHVGLFGTHFLLVHLIRTEESGATITVVDLEQNCSELKWEHINDEVYIYMYNINKDRTYNKCTKIDPH